MKSYDENRLRACEIIKVQSKKPVEHLFAV